MPEILYSAPAVAITTLIGLALVAATLRELWREWHDRPPEHPHVRMQRLREKENARNVSNRPGRDA